MAFLANIVNDENGATEYVEQFLDPLLRIHDESLRGVFRNAHNHRMGDGFGQRPRILDVGGGSGAPLALAFGRTGMLLETVDFATPHPILAINFNMMSFKADLSEPNALGELDAAGCGRAVVISNRTLRYLSNACDLVRQMIEKTDPGGVIAFDYLDAPRETEIHEYTAPMLGMKCPVFAHPRESFHDLAAQYGATVIPELDKEIYPYEYECEMDEVPPALLHAG